MEDQFYPFVSTIGVILQWYFERFRVLGKNFTDHEALKWLNRAEDLGNHFACCKMQLTGYDIDIKQQSGTGYAIFRVFVDSSLP